MGTTPNDIYRRGNQTSPRMDHVRVPADVTNFMQNGVEWVQGRSGGISTFSSATPQGTGRIWHLPKGTTYSDELFLVNDQGDHWSWEPAHDMEMADFRGFLAAVGRNFK
jgi:hypothetical protein